MVPGGAQRRTAARDARLIAALFWLFPALPINRSVPVFWQVWPGVSPWIGVVAGAVEQAASRAGANSTALCIDGLRGLNDPAHLEFPVLDRKGEAAFDQVERVLAELFVAPARQDLE